MNPAGLKLRKEERLGGGCSRDVYATDHPGYVIKDEGPRGNFRGTTVNELEAQRYEELPQNDKFRVAECFLVGDHTSDLIMVRVYGEHGDNHICRCPRTGICAVRCAVEAAQRFWPDLEDIHEENIIVDAAGVIWLIDYAY